MLAFPRRGSALRRDTTWERVHETAAQRHRLDAVVAVAAATASAQVGVPGLPPLPLPVPELPDPVTGTLRTAQSLPRAELRRLRVRELLRTERDTVEADPEGQPILRRQIGALSPTPEALERARAAGFTILKEQTLEGLGLRLVVLQAPDGLSTRRALRRLRELDPGGSYDYNHLYLDSGAATPAEETPAAPSSAAIPGTPAGDPNRADRHGRRCRSCRARGRARCNARLRRPADARLSWHGSRIAIGGAERRVRRDVARCDALCRGYILRSRRRFAVVARGRARLDGARGRAGRQHQPGRREERVADDTRARDGRARASAGRGGRQRRARVAAAFSRGVSGSRRRDRRRCEAARSAGGLSRRAGRLRRARARTFARRRLGPDSTRCAARRSPRRSSPGCSLPGMPRSTARARRAHSRRWPRAQPTWAARASTRLMAVGWSART